jgi:DNA-binding NtrC family response regulator
MIISDVTMPDMNGWQFLKAVKEVQTDTPVFLMSGRADHGIMKKAWEAWAAGFFAKPFDPGVHRSEDLRSSLFSELRLFLLQRRYVVPY